jgi:cob(I)alamin adenosyltransferase
VSDHRCGTVPGSHRTSLVSGVPTIADPANITRPATSLYPPCMRDEEATTEPLIEDPRPNGLRKVDSLVLVLTGDGKGKSSSAFGMVMRALARDWDVAVVQFVKSGDWNTGEEKICQRLGVSWNTWGSGFTWDSNDLEHDRAIARDAWSRTAHLITEGQHHLVVLDELTYLITWGWLEIEPVVEAISTRPPHVNIVCTGRNAHPLLIDLADTVTSMTTVKHAYDRGIAAKRGIDY